MGSIEKEMRMPERDAESGLMWLWRQVRMLGIAAFLAFFCIRGFIFEPFRIPSRSMEPTLLVGDFLFVSKFAYGNRLPLTDWFFWETGPKRGDIVVFKMKGSGLPGSFFGLGATLFIKRVIGVPGDHIAFKDGRVVINGTPLELRDDVTSFATKRVVNGMEVPVEGQVRTEVLGDTLHPMMRVPGSPEIEVAEQVVPEGMYVVMGDNRDNSRDSRYWQWPGWGFVPKHDIMGRAEFIFWSWDENWIPRFGRLGNVLRADHVEE